MPSSLTIISGMAPGQTGLGNLISQLISDKKRLKKETAFSCRIIWGRYGYSLKNHIKRKKIFRSFKDLFYWLRASILFHSGYLNTLVNQNILLIHPQTLGFKWCLNFIKKSKKPVWLFLADSCFFCVRSYNYIPGEKTACTRCIGGNFDNIKNSKCEPFPINDISAIEFVKSIKQLGSNQKVRFIAQNKNQFYLAKKHFGENAIIEISGLFLDDWLKNNSEKIKKGTSEYDIVFHGHPLEAKGVKWALDLALHLPNYRFLFPFAKNSIHYEVSSNCFFKKISWDTGLRDDIANCKLVLVPSLWSAPIEGSLIKSMSYGENTAVVENHTSFSDEIPDNAIIKLPFDSMSAMAQIQLIISNNYNISKEATKQFISDFKTKNSTTLQMFIDITQNLNCK